MALIKIWRRARETLVLSLPSLLASLTFE